MAARCSANSNGTRLTVLTSFVRRFFFNSAGLVSGKQRRRFILTTPERFRPLLFQMRVSCSTLARYLPWQPDLCTCTIAGRPGAAADQTRKRKAGWGTAPNLPYEFNNSRHQGGSPVRPTN